MSRIDTLRHISHSRIVAVIRMESGELAYQTAKALFAGGVMVVEITLTVPDAVHVIRRLRQEAPASALVGAGTVVTAEQAQEVLAAGAQFLVSPFSQFDLIPAAHEADVPAIVGGLTPTEIMTAMKAGADMVKVFPADAVGGPKYFKALQEPLPKLSLMASGGLTLDTMRDYLALNVSALAFGGSLMPRPLIRSGDWQTLATHARQFVERARRRIAVSG